MRFIVVGLICLIIGFMIVAVKDDPMEDGSIPIIYQ